MQKSLSVILFILILFSCQHKTETTVNQQQTDSIDGVAKAIPVKTEDANDIEIQTNIASKFTTEETKLQDGNLFISEDKNVKFYVWSSLNKEKPNDVVFPNERIKTETSQENGFIKITWTLEPSKKVPYYRMYEEFKSDTQHFITGFFYNNQENYDKYITEYKEFISNLEFKAKE